jgi:hypothetical protein
LKEKINFNFNNLAVKNAKFCTATKREEE